MPQAQTMTIDEKLAISNKAFRLMDAGDEEGGIRLMKTAPLPPYIAKVIKEKAGAEYLAGWNLSEAEAEFGSGWLNK